MLFHQAALRFFHLVRIEEFNLVFPFTTRGHGGGKRPTVELFAVNVAVKHRNTDTGAGAQLDPVQRQTFI
ncbi:Uncharacterised protein [Klebsiella pneumoniae]|nr:Uncharacterised protein [Klebsiella pneumoniae]